MKTLILSQLFGYDWDAWQVALIIVLLVLAFLLVLFILLFQMLKNKRKNKAQELKEVVEHQHQLNADIAKQEAKNAALRKEIEKEQQRLEDKLRAQEELEASKENKKHELVKQAGIIQNLLVSAKMTKKELDEYQREQKMFVPEDLIINEITNMVLSNSPYEMNESITDCTVVKDVTKTYTDEQVIKYLESKDDVSSGGSGRYDVYKNVGNTFAMLFTNKETKKLCITLKCGPTYASKIETIYNSKKLCKAKFPYGLLWYTVESSVSFEMLKQLIDISYSIAGLGY